MLADLLEIDISAFTDSIKRHIWTFQGDRVSLIRTICEFFGVADYRGVYEALSAHTFETKFFDDVHETLRALTPQYKIGLLSNTSVWTALDHRQLGLGEFCDLSVLSCAVGMAKPSKDIFEFARDQSRLAAHKLVYVGDTPEIDIAPALSAGWKAILVDRKRLYNDADFLLATSLNRVPALVEELG